MDSISDQLLELQEIDLRIHDIKQRVRSFDPALEEVDQSALLLEKDVETTSGRVQELRLDERRLTLALEEKRARVTRLEERLNQVRNVREESAVTAELGLVRRALESEEQEAITLMDQISRFDERLATQTAAWEAERAEVEPRRKEILAERDEAGKELDDLSKVRNEKADSLEPRYRRVYDNLIRGGRKAVGSMTEDGACGICFSVIPLQVQHEVRAGGSMVLCESCGVIITAPREEPEVEESEESTEAVEAAEDIAAEDEAGSEEE